jgi:hypothetical protein
VIASGIPAVPVRRLCDLDREALERERAASRRKRPAIPLPPG